MKKRIHYNPKLTQHARELRNNSTLSEVLLWQELKGDKMLGYDFHRQKPIDNFIVDFFCSDLMLAIEIDGSGHNGKEKYDAFRQQKLELLGIRFLRFDDLDVKQKMGWVLEEIQAWIKSNSTNDIPLAPPSRGEVKPVKAEGDTINSDFHENIDSTTTNSSDPIISSEFPTSKGGQGGVERNTLFIKKTAKHLGFSFCGISKAEFLSEEAPKLEEWLKRGYQGKMSYLENHFDKRLDPRLLIPGAKSVVSLVYNYYPKKDLSSKASAEEERTSSTETSGGNPSFAKASEGKLKIAKYAYGDDYHFVVKEKLKEFLALIQSEIGEVNGRAFVDSAPVHERAWAKKSGIGWVGKNSLLLNREMGSFFFLAELILDLELEADGPIKDYCGTCTACMDACPTDAIPQPYVVDGSKCISYFTIELKEEIPAEVKGKFENWIFGCDICQDVCPWNRFSKPHEEEKFLPHPNLEKMTLTEWQEITEDVFEKLFKKSAVKRTKLEGLKRNIKFIS